MEKNKRIIIKISGEFLGGKTRFGYDKDVLYSLADEIIEIKDFGYSVGLVIGGGNFFRGSDITDINRVAADNIGMLATIQNAIMFSEVLRVKDCKAEVFSAFPVLKVSKYYTYQEVNKAMGKKTLCLLCGGTGNPFFTTDTTAILRAIELDCSLVLKGTMVDGIYTADPKKDKDAKFIKEITYSEALDKQLRIMDMTAFSLARDYKMPIKVFDINTRGNIIKALLSDEIGTRVFE